MEVGFGFYGQPKPVYFYKNFLSEIQIFLDANTNKEEDQIFK